MRSRSKVANYASSSLLADTGSRSDIVNKLAAWLKDTRSSRQVSYLVQDIAKKLADSGYIYATITTAHPLQGDTRQAVETYLKNYYGKSITLEIDEKVQPNIVGGIRIDTPHGSLDATVRRKLVQIIKGVQR